jgi:tetratricopeptide (TPR) repeat protein
MPAKVQELPEMIGNRYRVEQLLGRGGMSVVYKVYDTFSNRHVALKHLSVRDSLEAQEQVVELFECEFHTLLHLSHPGVVRVYDYGRDEVAPYYTMEYVDGGDLGELSPLPWSTVCAYLCDVCSVVSLLHSRRLVHRDLTPRNIRCTRDQKAKLIDFGAMTPFGTVKYPVGTPQFVAPEAYLKQVVDGRTDLFSLGATAYFALTRRHAFPEARNWATMRDAWRTRPVPPSQYEPSIPGELDQLVLSLIHLDPTARPSSAAEVMGRLSGIASIPIDEQNLVRQAYLTRPTLVGRDDEILRARKQMVRTLRGRGATMVITGPAGVGRSRLLDAYALEGKLLGATVLRADSADANAGSWGAMQALARRLIDEIPQVALSTAAPVAPVLGHIIPEIFDRLQAWKTAEHSDGKVITTGGGIEGDAQFERPSKRPSLRPPPSAGSLKALKGFDSPQQLRAGLQSALRNWILEITKRRCLMIAVDDIHRIDEPSAAWVALLSQVTAQHRLLVVVTTESDAPATCDMAMALLTEAGVTVPLKNLSLEETEKLLGSVFGDAPNVRLMADRLQAISNGNPSAVMQFAQHLLDQGVVTYQGGTWNLPSTIEASDLPRTLSDAFRRRLQNLAASALSLAQAIALSSKQSFDFGHCLALSGHGDKAQLVADLNALVAREILVTDGDSYMLQQTSWKTVLAALTDQAEAKQLHLRLAELSEKGDIEPYTAARHFLLAEQAERALDLVISHLEAKSAHYRENPENFLVHVQSLPKDWQAIVESLLHACTDYRRPPLQRFLLLTHMLACGAITEDVPLTYLKEVIGQLYGACGLDIYRDLGDSVDASARLGRALTLAQERFEATPEFDRVLAPFEAIPRLAEVIVQAMALIDAPNGIEDLEALPSLEPLFPLSPALGIIQKNLDGVMCLAKGRDSQSRQGWIDAIDRLDQPDRAGLTETIHQYMRLAMVYGVAMIDVFNGCLSAAELIDELERHPVFEADAWRMRFLLALSQADDQQAEWCKRRVEFLQIQNRPRQFFEVHLRWLELIQYVQSEDLVQIKRSIADFEKLVERRPGWKRCVHFARGTYHRIRGDFAGALSEFEQALVSTPPGRYQVWPLIVAGLALTYLNLGRPSDAKRLTEEALADAARVDQHSFVRYIEEVLALAEATLKNFDSAIKHSDAVIDALQAMGSTGVILGIAYETRARVAILMGDQQGCERYARLCAEQYRLGQNSSLTAKYEKLMHDARRTGLIVTSNLEEEADAKEKANVAITALLSSCQGPQQRAERVLELIVRESGCSGGLFYTLQKDGPVRAAQIGDERPPGQIDQFVATFLSAELEASDEVTITQTDSGNRTQDELGWTGPDGKQFVPRLIGHRGAAGYEITAVAVLCQTDDREPVVPFELLPVVSTLLFKAGDVVTATAAV